MPDFPELADAAAVWTPVGEAGTVGPAQEMAHGAGTWRSRLTCGNPACRRGGFDLGSVVEGMISFREAEKAGLLVCEGWEEDPPANPTVGAPCVRAIQYRLRLTYHPAAPPPPSSLPGLPPPARGAS
jgi:hypothetical protein